MDKPRQFCNVDFILLKLKHTFLEYHCLENKLNLSEECKTPTADNTKRILCLFFTNRWLSKLLMFGKIKCQDKYSIRVVYMVCLFKRLRSTLSVYTCTYILLALGLAHTVPFTTCALLAKSIRA